MKRSAAYGLLKLKLWSSTSTYPSNFAALIQKSGGHAGKVAITRGPLVYCLESVDNPDVDIFTVPLDPDTLRDEFAPELLGGCVVIHAKAIDGRPLKFIPYFLWANRGESQMTVWVNSK